MTDTASCQHDGPGNEGGILAGPGQLGTQEARLPSAAGEAGGFFVLFWPAQNGMWDLGSTTKD